MKKQVAAVFLVLIMVAALAGCNGGGPADGGGGHGSNSEAIEGGELIVGIPSDLDASLDPHVSSSSAGTREILFNIFEGLVKPDTKGDLVPAVAESYKVNEAGDVYTFKIRSGVKFHDGSALTVDDVVYSLRRAAGLDTGTPLVNDVADIVSAEATDDRTVVVKLKAPNTEFITHASVAIIPEGNDPATALIGTGPFKYASRTVQDNIVLEKNTDYWGTPAHLDKVTLKVVDDPETMVMSLQSGAVELAPHMTATQVSGLSGLRVVQGNSNIVQALYLNNSFKPFSDVRVRRALSYGLDKQQVIDLAADGKGTPLGSSMFPAFGKYFVDELTDHYQYDPRKAKDLLAEAGYPDGFDFTVTVPSNMRIHVDTAQVIVEQYKAIGVNVKINQVEWATWLTDVYQGSNFQATVVGMDAHGVAASDLLARFVSSSPKNFIKYSSAAYDAKYAEAMAETDDTEKTKLVKECEAILTDEAANVYIQDPASFTVMAEDVDGFEFYPLYVLDLASVYRTK